MLVAYAALLGLLLASYAAPAGEIVRNRAEIPGLEARLSAMEDDLALREQQVEELKTPEGIERAAREKYGMILPGERVYLVPDAPDEDEDER